MTKVQKEITDEMSRLNGEVSELEIGSEEYLNAAKAMNQYAEAAGKLNKVDLNAMIPGITSVACFIMYMIFSDTHIMDTRPITFVKGLFRR